MLAKAHEQAEARGLRNVNYLEGDFSTLSSIESQSVDAVISSMALHHLPDREALTRCFTTIGRVLKPGGALYLMDFGRLRTRRAIEIFVSKVSRTESRSVTQDYRASLLAAYTPEDFFCEIKRLQRQEISLHRTIVTPLVMIACTPLPTGQIEHVLSARYKAATKSLTPQRRSELAQLRLFLQFGGMEFPS